MEDPKAQLAEKIQTATNILVTVSSNPSVDQLAACIGLTLWLNKINKHATAVFSGDIPNALEFLQPEATIEKNTDSLRDFIIALDKSKADKLRYKVEDRVVKIFITPYRTSLGADDLEFSQGDFNVDAIIALGVTKQEDLDNAIVSHGRILHDAVVATINTTAEGGIGSINWHDPTSSSLSELVYDLCQMIDGKQLDPQIATALLTGIVAETDRFSNKKTTPNTMNMSAALMSAGANQQLVANKLEEISPQPTAIKPEVTPSNPTKRTSEPKPSEQVDYANDGMLEINHDNDKTELAPPVTPDVTVTKDEEVINDQLSSLNARLSQNLEAPKVVDPVPPETVDHPSTTAASLDSPAPLNDVFSLPSVPTESLPPSLELPGPNLVPTDQSLPQNDNLLGAEDDQTLTEIERAVNSPHLEDIRSQVSNVFNEQDNNTAFNPADFELKEHDEGSSSGPPQVPPPIVPPDYLPPSPPSSP